MPIMIKENEVLANHSTFSIGGPAKYFIVVKSKEELIEALDFAEKKNLPFFVFGGGSNILCRDQGYGGIAIKIQNSKISFTDAEIIRVEAGTLLSQLIRESINANLTGLEWAMGIPGTVGGAVAGNAGAYGHSIAEFVKNVAVLSRDESGEWRIKNYLAEKCSFIYRGSRFKKSDNQEIILEVKFDFEKSDPEKSKNIIIDGLKNKEEFLKLIPRDKIKGGKFPAGWLIENCGLKGRQIGGAKIAEEHANYIVNAGGATAGDALKLIDLCKKKTREKFNLDLEEEIMVI